MANLPTTCLLAHRGFAAFGNPLFRRSDTDGAPVMVISLGDREAALPLKSLQREFGISQESPDGRMLELIAKALDFVHALRLGDALPLEVLTGAASWSPDPVHVNIANTRLRLHLVQWLGADCTDLSTEGLLQIADDPALRVQVQAAIDQAARNLGLGHPDEVLKLLEGLAEELSYVEALRDRLLGRVTAMAGKVEQLASNWRGAARSETLTQVRRLTAIALRQLRQRFDELDAQTGEVLAALRNADSQRAFIRSHRDWLYRSLLGWEPVLARWDGAGTVFDPLMAALLADTYHFLAPRFMPVKEWLSNNSPRPKSEAPRMMW